jgi:N-acyl-D-aspartate/D-glutamate deacylase
MESALRQGITTVIAGNCGGYGRARNEGEKGRS